MKTLLVVTILTIAICMPAFGQGRSRTSKSKAERDIMTLEDQWVKSRATKDPTTTRDLLADDFLGCNPDGQAQTKQQFIDSVRAGTFADGHPEYSERKVRIYGDTAVSTGLITGAGPNGTDKIRYVRVYVKRNNKWQAVSTQATRVVSG